ncbi:hypothetical protein [Streptomyces collinus]
MEAPQEAGRVGGPARERAGHRDADGAAGPARGVVPRNGVIGEWAVIHG